MDVTWEGSSSEDHVLQCNALKVVDLVSSESIGVRCVVPGEARALLLLDYKRIPTMSHFFQSE